MYTYPFYIILHDLLEVLAWQGSRKMVEGEVMFRDDLVGPSEGGFPTQKLKVDQFEF
jgi:hypothetical protein